MKCPACDYELTEIHVGEISVDVCQGGCGGIWFDCRELKKVDEPHESAGENLLHVERDGSVYVDDDRRRMCPNCDDMVMMRHFASVKREIEVDECGNCGGMWLDYGELNRLRDQFKTEDDRREAAQAFFTELFADELDELSAENEKEHRKWHRLAQMFRFLCPSYYIPGKQTWGAF